jgi:hypothetical protein
MQGCEYFKITDLVSHYMSHQNNGKDYKDFLSFVNDHYKKEDHQKHEHKHLPFKSGQINSIVIAYHIVEVKVVQEEQKIAEKTDDNFYYVNKNPMIHTGSVWNPPQYC